MLKMKSNTTEFLKKNLPKALEAESVKEALDLLYEFIDDYGFEPPDYEWYNDIGNAAQAAYDDIYNNN